MFSRCKPAHLWRKTGRKHFAYLIKERQDALPRPLDVRKRTDMLQLVSIVIGCTTGTAYSFGRFSPPTDLTRIVRPPGACVPPPKQKCLKSAVPPPCPKDKDQPPSEPCK